MSRDTTYDVIYNVWRLARPQGSAGSSIGGPDAEGPPAGQDESRAANGEAGGGGGGGAVAGTKVASAAKKVTMCACGKKGEHYSATAMEGTFPGTPEKIYNLMFASGFIKDFMRDDQKLLGMLHAPILFVTMR
jgi:hypothetical protein